MECIFPLENWSQSKMMSSMNYFILCKKGPWGRLSNNGNNIGSSFLTIAVPEDNERSVD